MQFQAFDMLQKQVQTLGFTTAKGDNSLAFAVGSETAFVGHEHAS